MSPPMRIIATGVLFVLWTLGGISVRAQTAVTFGQEYALQIPLPGDQSYPALSVSSQGGWLVWQDNGIDRTDLGIAACRLDENLQGIAQIIRIPSQFKGDQGHPGVAALPDGGAVFIWEGGTAGDPNAYLRFLGGNGKFLTKDISLNPRNVSKKKKVKFKQLSWVKNKLKNKSWKLNIKESYHRDLTEHPGIAALPNGNVVAVYSGVRQFQTNAFEIETRVATSTRKGVIRFTTNDVAVPTVIRGSFEKDIFINLFNGRGKSLGNEILVNQTEALNQRHPALAVLSDGRFVVVWISEVHIAQSLSDGSDIAVFARVFDADGNPLTDEFRVNEYVGIAAQPAVACRIDGGFTVVWNRRGAIRNDGWDVVGRHFDAAAIPTGETFQINGQSFGDQYVPMIANQGMNQLVVWTSLGQDGSREGVYGRLLSPDGPAGEEFLINTTTEGSQIQPTVASVGEGRFIVAWSAFTGATSFDLFAQQFDTTQPLPRPNPPIVAAIDESSLLVSWDAVEATTLAGYDLYMDDFNQPSFITGTEFTAGGLAAGSTHSFRLSYVLSDGRRSLLSAVASGQTLSGAVTETNEGGGDETPTSIPSTENPNLDPSAPAGNAAEPVEDITLTLQKAEKGLVLTWNTRVGVRYQVQWSDDLMAWFDLGEPRTATRTSDYLVLQPHETAAFFRVISLP